MAVTTNRQKDEFAALVANAVETAVGTCLDTTLPYTNLTTGLPTAGTRKVTRAQVLKAIARVALKKSTQGAYRREMATNPPLTPGV
jgi:hypothetical protein